MAPTDADVLATVERSLVAASARDRAGWLQLFTADGRVEDPVGSRPHVGAAQIARFYDTFIGPRRITAHRDADFVILCVSIGGLAAMRNDIEIPERYGIYQSVGDTVGPGGLARGLRHIPFAVQVAREMEERLGLKRPQPRTKAIKKVKGGKTRAVKPRSSGLRLSSPDRKPPQTKSKSLLPTASHRPAVTKDRRPSSASRRRPLPRPIASSPANTGRRPSPT